MCSELVSDATPPKPSLLFVWNSSHYYLEWTKNYQRIEISNLLLRQMPLKKSKIISNRIMSCFRLSRLLRQTCCNWDTLEKFTFFCISNINAQCISTNVTHACKVGRRQILPSEKNMLVFFFKICQSLNNCISVSALCDDSATYTQISTRTFFIGEHNLLRDAECLLTPKLEEKPSNLSKQQLDSDLVN